MGLSHVNNPLSDNASMKYDDASWHSGGKFPKDLPPEAGATHTGMFLAWALLNGLAGENFTDTPGETGKLASRAVTPGRFFLEACDGKFTDEDLSDEGNAFARAYFDFEKGAYLGDYEETLAQDVPELYYVKDSWENFDRLKPLLDRRYAEWKAERDRG